MTEEEWLTSSNDMAMLRQIESKTSVRKLRLLTCAAARSEWDNLQFDHWREQIEAGESLADGRMSQEEWNHARRNIYTIFTDDGATYRAIAEQCVNLLHASRETVASYNMMAAVPLYSNHMIQRLSIVAGWQPVRQVLQERIQAILRDIVGNPFRPVEFDSRWRSESAVALASAIYADRAFDRMPILADALEEAGCDHPDVLAYCRDPQQSHARGCWVVDLVLGKQ